MRDAAGRALRVVTDHNRVVILTMLLLTAGISVGVTDLQMDSQATSQDAFSDNPVVQKQMYVQEHYGPNGSEQANGSQRPAVRPAVVYVRDADGNVLSKSSLVSSLEFQQAIRQNASVRAALAPNRSVQGVATLVARRASGSPNAGLSEQLSTLRAMDDDEVAATVEQVLAPGSPALGLLPSDYEPGTATASSRRIVFPFQDVSDPGSSTGAERRSTVRSRATFVLYDRAGAGDYAAYFTLGEHAMADNRAHAYSESAELILPVSLVVILAVLAFAYRSLADVLVGMVGVVVAVLWMFGILGWLQVSAGLAAIIGPVLIVGLSVDYGLHVFMRYREERGPDEGIREPMHRGLSAVGVALALVTITTAVGFMANASSDLASIRNLAVGITLGVVSAFLVFTTLVPALKVSVDGLLERVGLDRRGSPLGTTGAISRFLRTGVTVGRKAAPVVVLVALVVGAAGGAAWTDLERQSFQQDTDGVAQWKQDLPDPVGWEVNDFTRNADYVTGHYRDADEESRRRSQLLVQGGVTDPATLDRLWTARQSLAGSDVVYRQGDRVPFVSVASVARSVAARNESFARVYRAADTDDDPMPDRNVTGVYDALYGAAPAQARRVVERTDGGYRSLLVTVPIKRNAMVDRQTDVMRDAAATAEGDAAAVTVTAVGPATVNAAVSAQLADDILTTLLVAFAAVFVILSLVYRLVADSASLGAVTVLPIALVTTLVVGGMWLFDVPLTLLTTLLMSLVIGLGIDYNIHVSDRFAHELDAGKPPVAAARTAVTGTGGALLGSTLTSTGAFSALLLHPHPQLQSFGTLVVLALSLSFVVSVFVLPSLLLLWARYVHGTVAADASPTGTPTD